jgi:anti-sigma-K factor RskA
LAELRSALHLLPYGLPTAEPPAELRERILERVRASQTGAVAARTAPARRTRLQAPWWRRFAPALIAGALILGYLLGRFVPGSTTGDIATQPNARTITLAGQGSGAFVVAPETRRVHITLNQLPPLSQGRVYQLWMLGPEAPVSVGTFVVDANGRAELDFSGLAWSPNYTGVAITPEPQGGLPTPSGQIVAKGNF